MSTSRVNVYVQQRNSMYLSFLLTLLFGTLSILIAVTNPVSENFFTTILSPLYQDTDTSRYLLVAVEWILFMLVFAFLTIALATRKEMNGGIPDWLEVVTAAIFTIAFGSFVVNLNYLGGQTGFSGDQEGFGSSLQGISNFNGDMKFWIFILDIVGVILLTTYFYYASLAEEKD